MACPNINLDSWKLLVAARGENVAYALWDLYDGNVPESESKSSIVKSGLKSVDALQSEKAIKLFSSLEKNRVKGDAFWNKVQSDLSIPKDQIELLKSFNTTDRNELITNMLANYSYTVEINTSTSSRVLEDTPTATTAYRNFEYKGEQFTKSDELDFDGEYKEVYRRDGKQIKRTEFIEFAKKAEKERAAIPTTYYANLSVPGGTNYTENEIATPAITPSIKGHAQFATDQGIGWFRSDEQLTKDKLSNDIIISKDGDVYFTTFQRAGSRRVEIIEGVSEEDVRKKYMFETNVAANKSVIVGDTSNLKTRRILEVQSDLFQKGRENKFLEKPGTKKAAQEDLESGDFLPDVEIGDTIEDYQTDSTGNQFLQLLNKDNNWVTFFIKSIIQSTAKQTVTEVQQEDIEAKVRELEKNGLLKIKCD